MRSRIVVRTMTTHAAEFSMPTIKTLDSNVLLEIWYYCPTKRENSPTFLYALGLPSNSQKTDRWWGKSEDRGRISSRKIIVDQRTNAMLFKLLAENGMSLGEATRELDLPFPRGKSSLLRLQASEHRYRYLSDVFLPCPSVGGSRMYASTLVNISDELSARQSFWADTDKSLLLQELGHDFTEDRRQEQILKILNALASDTSFDFANRDLVRLGNLETITLPLGAADESSTVSISLSEGYFVVEFEADERSIFYVRCLQQAPNFILTSNIKRTECIGTTHTARFKVHPLGDYQVDIEIYRVCNSKHILVYKNICSWPKSIGINMNLVTERRRIASRATEVLKKNRRLRSEVEKLEKGSGTAESFEVSLDLPNSNSVSEIRRAAASLRHDLYGEAPKCKVWWFPPPSGESDSTAFQIQKWFIERLKTPGRWIIIDPYLDAEALTFLMRSSRQSNFDIVTKDSLNKELSECSETRSNLLVTTIRQRASLFRGQVRLYFTTADRMHDRYIIHTNGKSLTVYNLSNSLSASLLKNQTSTPLFIAQVSGEPARQIKAFCDQLMQNPTYETSFMPGSPLDIDSLVGEVITTDEWAEAVEEHHKSECASATTSLFKILANRVSERCEAHGCNFALDISLADPAQRLKNALLPHFIPRAGHNLLRVTSSICQDSTRESLLHSNMQALISNLELSDSLKDSTTNLSNIHYLFSTVYFHIILELHIRENPEILKDLAFHFPKPVSTPELHALFIYALGVLIENEKTDTADEIRELVERISAKESYALFYLELLKHLHKSQSLFTDAGDNIETNHPIHQYVRDLYAHLPLQPVESYTSLIEAVDYRPAASRNLEIFYKETLPQLDRDVQSRWYDALMKYSTTVLTPTDTPGFKYLNLNLCNVLVSALICGPLLDTAPLDAVLQRIAQYLSSPFPISRSFHRYYGSIISLIELALVAKLISLNAQPQPPKSALELIRTILTVDNMFIHYPINRRLRARLSQFSENLINEAERIEQLYREAQSQNMSNSF